MELPYKMFIIISRVFLKLQKKKKSEILIVHLL